MHSFLQSLTEKQAKELREMKGGRSILENLNDRFVIIELVHLSAESDQKILVTSFSISFY